MGLRRVWTVSHGHLDHSRDSLCNRHGLALTIGTRLVTILVSMASYLRVMSALPPESGHVQCKSQCPLRANSGLMHRSKKRSLFDHLIGAGDERRRDGEAN